MIAGCLAPHGGGGVAYLARVRYAVGGVRVKVKDFLSWDQGSRVRVIVGVMS